MKKVLFVTNIPSPYRVDFYNQLGKFVDLTVIFEATGAQDIRFDYRETFKNFTAIFLSEGNIDEKKLNSAIFQHLIPEKYDYIFLTNYSYRTELFGYLKCVFSKIPFILEIDGGKIPESENFLKYQFKKFILTKPYYYFSPSQSSDDCLAHYHVNKENIYRYSFTSLSEKDIRYQIVDEKEKQFLRKKLGFSPTKKTILFVGSIIPRKGVDVLIKAVQNLSDNVQCLIVGPSPDSEYKQYLLTLIGQDSRFHFIDFLQTSELKQYYKLSDIFVLPTKYDVWGLVVNEAMSQGLPVISTSACVAAIELVSNGYNGYVIDRVDDWKAIFQKLSQVLQDDSLRVQLSQNALSTIKHYTIETMVEEHLKFMEEK